MAEDFRGKLGGLEGEEFDNFLEGSYLARVACLTPDGAPYVIPLWYQWDGSAMWFVGRQRAGRVVQVHEERPACFAGGGRAP